MKARVNFKAPGAKWYDVESILEAKETEAPVNYSRTGYGRRIPTRYMVRHAGRWLRVYVVQISNAGTCYIGPSGNWLAIVHDVGEDVS